MSKGGFWDNPFGGLLDFNGDGKEDLAEQFLGYKMFEECLYKMVDEILAVSDMLENDYYNPKLSEFKENFSIYYMTAQEDADHENKDAIQNHIGVVIDFYKRFVKRIVTMMENNRNTNVISIMGP